MVSPLVTIKYHNFSVKSIWNIVQTEQNAIVQNTELRLVRTKMVDKDRDNLV